MAKKSTACVAVPETGENRSRPLAVPPVRVLLVEDDEDDYVMTRDLLADIGPDRFEIEWVADYEDALAAVAREEHDVCLVDLRLGQHSGLDFLRVAREKGYDAPAIVLTGQSSRDVDVEAMRAGAAYYLVKAKIDAPVLERSIRYALQLKLAQRALRESEERLRLAVESSGTGLWDWNLQRRHAYYSPLWKRQLGYADDEIGDTFEDFTDRLHPDDRERVVGALGAHTASPELPFHAEFRLRHKDGSYRWLLSRAALIRRPDGRPLRMLGAHIDITERRQSEEEIRRLNSELEARVAERTAQLLESNRELEAFSYSVSHDLRTPLRAIEGFAAALAEDYPDALDVEAASYVERIRTAATRTGHLIEGLLRLSRLTRSRVRSAEVDIGSLAHSICAELRLSEPEREVEFVIAEGERVVGDRELLRILLENLLANAWKYTRHHPSARVELGQLSEEQARAALADAGLPSDAADRVTYFVRDDGAGFDPARAANLFTPFGRLHSSAQFEGMGIGLATVDRIVRRHGGRVWARGAVEQGATFFFTLPRRRSRPDRRP